MNATDFIENAVLKEIEKYEYGTFTDQETVDMQIDAVELCLFKFDPIKTREKVEKIVAQKYREIY